MPVDTGTFVAGVGVLVSLDLAVLGISVQNARRVGKDPKAREKAAEAHEAAKRAHEKARGGS
ncbi:hypothetical protein LPA44_04080 [Halobacterium sp. KA-4]|uniref:hypothetical protein n=1 Tax=Halobacterium sp. KA-4 TaxID=2896367 RepID=UPI001E533F13|nr:hypothetical protein [Halobacterium sp. KA-4]MCD2199077.1 hypothetical protein [Halobacterium sp. KA-4]